MRRREPSTLVFVLAGLALSLFAACGGTTPRPHDGGPPDGASDHTGVIDGAGAGGTGGASDAGGAGGGGGTAEGAAGFDGGGSVADGGDVAEAVDSSPTDGTPDLDDAAGDQTSGSDGRPVDVAEAGTTGAAGSTGGTTGAAGSTAGAVGAAGSAAGAVGAAGSAGSAAGTTDAAAVDSGSDVPTGGGGGGTTGTADGSSDGTGAPDASADGATDAAGAAALGEWSPLMTLPIIAVHASLLPDGRILMSDGQGMFGSDARVWDPVTNAAEAKPAPSNVFCAGLEQMTDGRILVVGGHLNAHYGTANANAYDPATNSWTPLGSLNTLRWYPSVIVLPDGRYVMVGGENSCNNCNDDIPELYDPATDVWTPMSVDASFIVPYYPHLFLLPDGRVFVPSSTRAPIASQIFDVDAPSWTTVGGPAVDGGAAVMYRPGKFLKAGTSVDPDLTATPTAPTAYVIDMTQVTPAPVWRQVASMHDPRAYHTLTMLPDGNVLVTGGGPTTAPTDVDNGILRAEMWSPTTEAWTPLASMAAARLYHSGALLLPDGRVVILGGGRFDNVTVPTDQFSAQIYSPPYLFKGARPKITSAPATLTRGQTFAVQTPDAARIASVALVRFGSVTHSTNTSQRYLPLSFTAGASTLTVTLPASIPLSPGGNYMLFLVDASGVPSVAAIVRL